MELDLYLNPYKQMTSQFYSFFLFISYLNMYPSFYIDCQKILKFLLLNKSLEEREKELRQYNRKFY